MYEAVYHDEVIAVGRAVVASAARALLARGVVGNMRVVREDGTVSFPSHPIAAWATRTVSDPDRGGGPRFEKWKPFDGTVFTRPSPVE
jgi:hypothetical protein